ncbi:hypothetical protein DV515_00009796 [Chloebia gouldiae]|uniref:Uncharacterized protein n=1 Tax=Chloebia gouldiae TaxID=44316 RepID=A0A3L8SAZ2_CHLGU|nr:hypothetical protein DV515_00009796 [Chloebia gouldiae]
MLCLLPASLGTGHCRVTRGPPPTCTFLCLTLAKARCGQVPPLAWHGCRRRRQAPAALLQEQQLSPARAQRASDSAAHPGHRPPAQHPRLPRAQRAVHLNKNRTRGRGATSRHPIAALAPAHFCAPSPGAAGPTSPSPLALVPPDAAGRQVQGVRGARGPSCQHVALHHLVYRPGMASSGAGARTESRLPPPPRAPLPWADSVRGTGEMCLGRAETRL